MQDSGQDLSDYQIGDKIRVRIGLYAGTRGIICGRTNELWQIELSGGKVQSFHADELTNYSRAARRAWQAMPKRAGRPPSNISRKKMVSLRIDIDIWEKLGQAVEQGLVVSREQVVNDCIKEKLSELFMTSDDKS